MPTPSRLGLLFAAVALIVLAWPTEASASGCQTNPNCGTNTPVLYDTPILGLSMDYERNVDGVRIEPGSIVFRDTCKAAGAVHLGIRNGQFYGRRGGAGFWNSDVACSGEALEGTIFTITAPLGHGAWVSARIEITDGPVAYKTWHRLKHQQETLHAYRLAWHDANALAKPEEDQQGVTAIKTVPGTSICPESYRPMDERQAEQTIREINLAWPSPLQLDTIAGFTSPPLVNRLPLFGDAPVDLGWFQKSDYLVLAQGETYGIGIQNLGVTHEGPRWFSMGCFQSAVAKMRFLGFDPMAGGAVAVATRPHRIATLMMLGAWYSPNKESTSPADPYSYPGVDIYYRWLPAWTPYAGPNPYDLGVDGTVNPIEAYWNDHGAPCLSHRRTFFADGRWLTLVYEQEPGFQPPTSAERMMLTTQTFFELNGKLTGTSSATVTVAEEQARARQMEHLSLADIQLGGCTDPGPFGLSPYDDVYWETRTVDHISHQGPTLESLAADYPLPDASDVITSTVH